MHQLPLVRKVASLWQRRGWQPAPLVVAVSGGPDSMALLRVLIELRPATDPPLIIAHLNHQLRGPESDADEAFVYAQWRRLQENGVANLAYHCKRHDIYATAHAQRHNLESTARHLRYNWLTQLAQDCQAGWIATGHTADDQAETVLHRLLRGTGLRGLRGIAVQRAVTAQVHVIRPLLTVHRADVMDYLQSMEQPFRHDDSNDDLRFTRNRIRRELLPYLAERYNPALADVLCRVAEQANETYADIETRAAQLLGDCEQPRVGGMLIFDRRCLRDAPRYLVREAFRLVWLREDWPTGAMTFARWEALAELVFGTSPQLDLPAGVRATARKRVVRLERRQ